MNPITNHDWWIMKIYQQEKTAESEPVSRPAVMICLMCYSFARRDTLAAAAEGPPFSTDNVPKVLRVDLFKEHKHGYSQGFWRAFWTLKRSLNTTETVTKYLKLEDVGQTLQWRGEERRRRRGGQIGRKNGAGGREMSEDASQCFHVLPVLPLTRGFTLRNLPPVVLHSVLNWPYRYDLFAQKGDIWTGIIRGPDLRVSAKYSSLPEMFSAAKLLQKLWVGVSVAAGRAALGV